MTWAGKLLNPNGFDWDEYVVMHLREIVAAVVIGVVTLIALRHVELPGGTVLSGRVSSQGKAVVFGTITAIATNGRTFNVPIQPDGTYSLRNLPAGPVRLAVSSPNPTSVVDRQADAAGGPTAGPAADAQAPAREASARSAKGRKPARPPGQANDDEAVEGVSIAASPETSPTGHSRASPETTAGQGTQGTHAGWFRIPGRYANPLTSGLKADIGRGRKTLDLSLD